MDEESFDRRTPGPRPYACDRIREIFHEAIELHPDVDDLDVLERLADAVGTGLRRWEDPVGIATAASIAAGIHDEEARSERHVRKLWGAIHKPRQIIRATPRDSAGRSIRGPENHREGFQAIDVDWLRIWEEIVGIVSESSRGSVGDIAAEPMRIAMERGATEKIDDLLVYLLVSIGTA